MIIIPNAVRLVENKKTVFRFDSNLPKVTEVKCDGYTDFELPPIKTPNFELEGYCHLTHTDWLKCVVGEAVIIVQANKKLVYIPAYAGMDYYIEVKPKVWHCGINPTGKTCIGDNLVIRHKPKHNKDYRPAKLSRPGKEKVWFNLETALLALSTRSPIEVIEVA
jgi:hypothetical protein